MPRDKRDVEQALQRKGFKLFHQKKDHRFFRYYTTQGKKTHIITKTSHGSKSKTLGDPLLNQMARQCQLSKHAFVLYFIDCPLDDEKYEMILSEKGEIKHTQ